MSKQFRYKNILLYSSLQFTGNIEEYFSQTSERMVSYIIVPRLNYKNNLVRLYVRGQLISEDSFTLSQNIVIYYALILFYQLWFLIKYFRPSDRITLITFHPVSFFGMTFQRLLRRITFVYWVADYFPPVNRSLMLFEKLKDFYNTRVDYVCYLSDIINKKMNGKILRSEIRKTVMWGIVPRKIERKKPAQKLQLLFVGVIRESQGLEFLFQFLKTHKEYTLNIIGDCDAKLYKRYQKIILKNDIAKNIFFPNRFYSLEELAALAKKCDIGVALYDADASSATYYTDPGKVKTYTQLGLPVIMSDTSAIAEYIAKYTAGLVIEKKEKELEAALSLIRNTYPYYMRGVQSFNTYFSYMPYYGRLFRFMERV